MVWVVDAEKDGDVDLNISTHIRNPNANNSVALFCDSIVQVRHLPALGEGAVELLGDVHNHAAGVHATRGSRGVRANQGDSGSMHPVGSRVMRDRVAGSWISRYVALSSPEAQPALAACVRAAAQLASTSVPAVLRVMQDMEDDAGLHPMGGMAGDGTFARVSHTMDVSVDLSNSSHYDANDASQSFSIWTEEFPGTTNSWYFVLPNVFGKKNKGGHMYNGVAIKLTHGTLISWDGRLIRHCTSVMDRKEGGHVYGTFFGAKTKLVHYGIQRAIASERQRRVYVEGLHGGVGGSHSPVVDTIPGQESRVLIDTDDIGLDGSVSSAESEGSAWIGALSEDLCLGTNTHDDDSHDDNTIDEGVPVADAIEGDHISDSGLWDEPAVASWRIPRRCDNDGLDGSCPPLSQLHSRLGTFIPDRHVPDLMAQRTECWRCVACESLYVDGGEDIRCRDALRFVTSGGSSFRETIDARETRHPNLVHQMNQQMLRPFCPFVPGLLDGNRVHVRVYYPYFRVQENGDVRSLFDVLHPRKVTGLHLIRASRVLVPCPHLQFHFEEF